MSKFKPGDRVRHAQDPSVTATVLAVHDSYYWVQCDGGWPNTYDAESIDRYYEPIPEPFLPNGDKYYKVYTNGGVGVPRSMVDAAERVDVGDSLGIIRIDGQTGELSWVKGGPTAEHSQNRSEG